MIVKLHQWLHNTRIEAENGGGGVELVHSKKRKVNI
jgi:hypothetical protein